MNNYGLLNVIIGTLSRVANFHIYTFISLAISRIISQGLTTKSDIPANREIAALPSIEPDCPVFLLLVQAITLLLSQRDCASRKCRDHKYCFMRGVCLCGAFGSSAVPGCSTRQPDQNRSTR